MWPFCKRESVFLQRVKFSLYFIVRILAHVVRFDHHSHSFCLVKFSLGGLLKIVWTCQHIWKAKSRLSNPNICLTTSVIINTFLLGNHTLIFPIAGLYALINNAGVCVCGEFEWQTWHQIEHQIQVNVMGTLRVTKAFLPLLKSSENGKKFFS